MMDEKVNIIFGKRFINNTEEQNHLIKDIIFW